MRTERFRPVDTVGRKLENLIGFRFKLTHCAFYGVERLR
jgi:hypothetical protein